MILWSINMNCFKVHVCTFMVCCHFKGNFYDFLFISPFKIGSTE